MAAALLAKKPRRGEALVRRRRRRRRFSLEAPSINHVQSGAKKHTHPPRIGTRRGRDSRTHFCSHFHICNEGRPTWTHGTVPPHIRPARGNATSRAAATGSPLRRARMEASGTDCGGSSPLNAHPHAARAAAQLYLLLLLLRSLHWGYLLNLSLYLGALSSLPKLATCQKSGAAAEERSAGRKAGRLRRGNERTTALKGQLARSPRCPSSLGRQWRWRNLLGFALGIE